MELKDVIFHRRSVRSYTGQLVDEPLLEEVRAFAAGMKPLYPDIRVRWEIVDRAQVRCILPWITPQVISIFTEEREGAYENVGFLFQQLDLYLQSRGLGACWLGMGRPGRGVETKGEDGLLFAMMLAFGHPKDGTMRAGAADFRRKAMSSISDQEDLLLEPARLAPSSINSQPWYFSHERDVIHVFCVKQGLLKPVLGDMNRMDVGIALAHLYVTNPDTFRFFRAQQPPERKGYGYIGSIEL